MTTEDDFQAMLDADPSDHYTRIVFADWLQDRGDVRADGYRALGILKRRPYDLGGSTWFACESGFGPHYGAIPDDWLAKCKGNKSGRFTSYCSQGVSRRSSEDVVARAFSKLPPERRQQLLSGVA